MPQAVAEPWLANAVPADSLDEPWLSNATPADDRSDEAQYGYAKDMLKSAVSFPRQDTLADMVGAANGLSTDRLKNLVQEHDRTGRSWSLKSRPGQRQIRSILANELRRRGSPLDDDEPAIKISALSKSDRALAVSLAKPRDGNDAATLDPGRYYIAPDQTIRMKLPDGGSRMEKWWEHDAPVNREQALQHLYNKEIEARGAPVGLSNVYASAIQAGAAVAAPALRPVAPYSAAQIEALASAREGQAEQIAAQQTDYPIIARAARGAMSTLPSMMAAGRIAGPYGALVAAGAQEASSSYHEARVAGLAPGEAAIHSAKQGVAEAGIGGVFQKLGLGGLEDVLGGNAPAVQKGVMNVLKKAGITTLKELPEEAWTTFQQTMQNAISGVDLQADTPENIGKALGQTALQTLMSVGAAHGIQAATKPSERASQAAQFANPENVASVWSSSKGTNAQEALQKLAQSEKPSRSDWKAAGLPEAFTSHREPFAKALKDIIAAESNPAGPVIGTAVVNGKATPIHGSELAGSLPELRKQLPTMGVEELDAQLAAIDSLTGLSPSDERLLKTMRDLVAFYRDHPGYGSAASENQAVQAEGSPSAEPESPTVAPALEAPVGGEPVEVASQAPPEGVEPGIEPTAVGPSGLDRAPEPIRQAIESLPHWILKGTKGLPVAKGQFNGPHAGEGTRYDHTQHTLFYEEGELDPDAIDHAAHETVVAYLVKNDEAIRPFVSKWAELRYGQIPELAGTVTKTAEHGVLSDQNVVDRLAIEMRLRLAGKSVAFGANDKTVAERDALFDEFIASEGKTSPIQAAGEAADEAEAPAEKPVRTPPPEIVFSPARRTGAKPISRSVVASVFPGAQIEHKPSGWRVQVGGSYVDIDTVAEVKADWPAFERRMGRKLSPEERNGFVAAGRFGFKTDDGQVHDGLGIIQLAEKMSDDATLRHEALHLARKTGILTEAEWGKLKADYGDSTKNDYDNEELVAQARESWTGAKTVWERIQTWLRNLLAKLGIDRRTSADVMRLMDESGFWQRPGTNKAAEPATQLKARPDLANIGETAATRDFVDEVDEQRNEASQPEVRPDVDVQAEAKTRLDADYDGERQRILALAKSGGQLTDADTVMAKAIYNRVAIEAVVTANPQAIADANEFADAYRRSGTEQARAFRQRRDPIESPAERNQRLIAEAVLTPPDKIRDKINTARTEGDQATIDRLNAEWAKKLAELKAKLKALGVDLDKLNEMGYDPIRQAQIVSVIQSQKSSIPDKLYEYWRNAILSSGVTQAANLSGNFGHATWHYTAERMLETGINTLTKRPEGAQWGELKHMYAGMLPGLSRGARNFVRTLSTEMPQLDKELKREGQFRYETPNVAIGGGFGKKVRIPQRILLAADEFAKSLFVEMDVAAQAFRIAKAEGKSGEDLRQRMAELTQDLESPAWDAGYHNVLDLTFQQRGSPRAGKVKRAVLDIRRNIPGIRYLMPFVTTPVNIFETSVRKSPMGTFTHLVPKLYDNYKAGKPIFHGATAQLAQQTLAWGLVLALLSNDEDDPWITGASSQWSPKTRDLSRRTYPPQSIKLGDTWISYARVEPFATVIASTVDGVNALKSGDALRLATTPFASLAGQVTDKTFLSGIGDFYEAAQESVAAENAEQRLEPVGKWASNFAVSWIPNIVRTGGRSADDELQQRGVWGKGGDWWAMLAQRTAQKAEIVPGESQPIYDLWGRTVPNSASPIPKTDWLYRMTVPATNKQEDIFIGDRLILNWNNQNPDSALYPGPVRKIYSDGGKNVYMTDEQFADYSGLSGKLAAALVESSTFNVDTPTEKDMTKLTAKIARGRELARNRLVAYWRGKGPKPDDSPEGVAAILGRSRGLLSYSGRR